MIYIFSLLSGEDDLDILTALLIESEGVGEDQDGQEQADDLDALFDDEYDDEEGEEYKDGIEEEGRDVATEDAVSDLFGDVDDIESEEREKDTKGKEGEGEACKSLTMSKEDLQGLCLSTNLNSKHFQLMYGVI